MLRAMAPWPTFVAAAAWAAAVAYGLPREAIGPTVGPERIITGKTITLNNGATMPSINLGTCCGSAPKVGLAPWLAAGGVVTTPPDPAAESEDKKRRLEYSTKVRALVTELADLKRKAPSDKTVVFSQWTSFLNIIQLHLEANGIHFVRLDGSMSLKKRKESIDTFRTDKSITVFLVSLKAGGVGLNLTCANRAYFMDPWWNPAVEDQVRWRRLGNQGYLACVEHYKNSWSSQSQQQPASMSYLQRPK